MRSTVAWTRWNVVFDVVHDFSQEELLAKLGIDAKEWEAFMRMRENGGLGSPAKPILLTAALEEYIAKEAYIRRHLSEASKKQYRHVLESYHRYVTNRYPEMMTDEVSPHVIEGFI